MTQCPVAYWSTPLSPEDRLPPRNNGKKTIFMTLIKSRRARGQKTFLESLKKNHDPVLIIQK